MNVVTELILVLISAALVNNVILSQFLGLCPFLGVSKKVETAAGIFILVIAALVQLVEMVLKKSMPSLYKALGVYLPLITTNCAVLGVALTNVQKYADGNLMLFSIFNGAGTAIGFTIAIVLMASIRERIEHNDVTKSFRGQPIVLVTAGLMAIAFCGFAGII